MWSVRVIQRLLILFLIFQAAAERPPPPVPQPPLIRQFENVEEQDGGVVQPAVGGNTLSTAEMVWEIKRSGTNAEQQQRRYFPIQNGVLPFVSNKLNSFSYEDNENFKYNLRSNEINSKFRPNEFRLPKLNENPIENSNENYIPAEVSRPTADACENCLNTDCGGDGMLCEKTPSVHKIKQPKQMSKRDKENESPFYPYKLELNEEEMRRPMGHHFQRAKAKVDEQTKYLPSISAGAIATLTDYFKDLSKNVKYTDTSQLEPADEQLLHGDHPFRMLHDVVDDDEKFAGKTNEILNALRTYRPSQKIRSLVSRNPYGYHGSQYIDPNYVWLGLGK